MPTLDLTDYLRILHPAITVMVVFPLVGIVINLAWQTRQRRLAESKEAKTQIPAIVGFEHVQYGKWLAGAVVGTSILGMIHPTARFFMRVLYTPEWNAEAWNQVQGELFITIALMVVTVISLAFLYLARHRLWTIVFGVLTALGVVLLGFQDKVFSREGYGAIFRRDDIWYMSHFYLGITSAVLMVISLMMIQEIYRDRSQKFRWAHIILNSFAFLLFLGQAFTGSRDLLEIPIAWQEPYIISAFNCRFEHYNCPPSVEEAKKRQEQQ